MIITRHVMCMFSAGKPDWRYGSEAHWRGFVGKHRSRDERADCVREPTTSRPPPDAGARSDVTIDLTIPTCMTPFTDGEIVYFFRRWKRGSWRCASGNLFSVSSTSFPVGDASDVTIRRHDYNTRTLYLSNFCQFYIISVTAIYIVIEIYIVGT